MLTTQKALFTSGKILEYMKKAGEGIAYQEGCACMRGFLLELLEPEMESLKHAYEYFIPSFGQDSWINLENYILRTMQEKNPELLISDRAASLRTFPDRAAIGMFKAHISRLDESFCKDTDAVKYAAEMFDVTPLDVLYHEFGFIKRLGQDTSGVLHLMTETIFRQLYASMSNALIAAFHMHKRALQGGSIVLYDKDGTYPEDIEAVIYSSSNKHTGQAVETDASPKSRIIPFESIIEFYDAESRLRESIGFFATPYGPESGEDNGNEGYDIETKNMVLYDHTTKHAVIHDLKAFEENVRRNIAKIIDLIPVVTDIGFYRA